MLEFLQDRFTAGLAPSTLKVYVAVISAYHIPLGGMYMEKDPLVSQFLLDSSEAEACSSHQGADMGSGHCPARPFPGSFRAFRGGAGQVFDIKSIVSPCNLIYLQGDANLLQTS